ncbi:hypothetical protein HPB50_008951 [Hyalomma asiaticum]|uniref:Uncharacterized protein n=1 Tax=Hyalomma asiaticum TaxID=266040 RepID=A0ACB7S014_HYAAI|nr:hypothetical protein HPB50_008951 [Hyalomma asiaticum]
MNQLTEQQVLLSLFAELSQVEVEPVGRWFEAVYQNARTRHVSSAASIGSESSDEGEGGSAAEDPAETQYLLSLDPKEWKSQDHYRVLGLQSKRHAATEHDIKKAYRRKVLLHHPDKRRTAGEQVRDLERDYFSCITREDADDDCEDCHDLCEAVNSIVGGDMEGNFESFAMGDADVPVVAPATDAEIVDLLGGPDEEDEPLDEQPREITNSGTNAGVPPSVVKYSGVRGLRPRSHNLPDQTGAGTLRAHPKHPTKPAD